MNAFTICDAIKNNDIDFIKKLIESDKKYLNEKINSEEKTLLCFSAEHGMLNICKYLIDNGATPESCAPSSYDLKKSPLWFACKNGHLDVVKFLDKYLKNKNIYSLIEIVCINNHYEIVDYYKPLITNGNEMNNIIDQCIKNNNIETISYLYKNGYEYMIEKDPYDEKQKIINDFKIFKNFTIKMLLLSNRISVSTQTDDNEEDNEEDIE